jgi:hypothetical protein
MVVWALVAASTLSAPPRPLLPNFFAARSYPRERKCKICAETGTGSLHAVIGRGHIGKFLEDLARPFVVTDSLSAAYAEMSATRTAAPRRTNGAIPGRRRTRCGGVRCGG